MAAKRLFGIALVLVAVLAALGLDWVGRDHQPRTYRIDFVRGTEIAASGERRLERVAAAMARQPAYDAVIVGHTGTRGSAAANRALGQERAQAVARILRDAGIADARIQTFSAGGEEPLERGADEGERGYQARLSRAEVRLNP